ncbi:heavy metal translocating P-type ATPase [Clostridium tarantellae]|uniref:Cadmium-translocating P-type ATPase n=1 Tax=Clostridium tarantellae TaxID=39493 RepID=A0A6I1MLF0_9CLOT|nr:heavy metal translocating P-type ATPase [Clostridium tarantellae]MPQ43850.1 cadmium-translocating P-type ATPase [Clostridium tarantellae]
MEVVKLYLEGLNCAGCAVKIENKINKLNGVKEANLNFTTKLLVIETLDKNFNEEIKVETKSIVTQLEPHVKVLDQTIKNKTIKRPTYGHAMKTSNKLVKSRKKSHDHSHSMGIEHSVDKKRLIKFGGAVGLFIIGLAFNLNKNLELIIFLISYLLAGGNIILKAINNIIKGQVFDENFLMTVATIGAFAVGQYPEGAAVMIFYQVGELLQDYAVNKSRKSIADLMDIRPDYANVIKSGVEKRISPENVKINDIIIVKTGEKVPLDGVVINGIASLDTSALTGESLPKDVQVGDEALAGCINKSGLIEIRVTKIFKQSTVAKILDLVENAGNKKAYTEKFITKFARYYTPIVVILAILIAIIPPIFIPQASFSQWVYRALIFLVVSCPCALVVSIPLSFFAGIGLASRNGALIKGGNYLEALNHVETIVLDKTGTLTKGVFKVSKINTENNISKEELHKIAAYAEVYSNHPIAKSIVDSFYPKINKDKIKDYEEIAGMGIKVLINNRKVLAGNIKLMESNNINIKPINAIGTVVYFALENKYIGNIVISDELKNDSIQTIKQLKNVGIKETIMLTGDNKEVGEAIAKECGIDKVYCELLPQDKVSKIEEILNNKSQKGKVAFVGDGINDAPVLARADIGIAMGGIGADAAIEAADVVIMNDEPSKIVTSIKIAKLTKKIVWQNIILSFGVKMLIIILGAFGMATMWEAIFGDVGVTLLAILNCSRIFRKNLNL